MKKNKINNKQIKSILFIFGPGRKNKIKNSNNYSKEFFYGYFHFKNIGYDTEIIEFDPSRKGLCKEIILLFDRVLRKITNLPFFMSHLIAYKNLKKIIKYKNLVLTLDRAAISLLFPLIIIGKILNINSLVIVMGLIKKNNKSFIDTLFVKMVFFTYSNFAFLGKSEYQIACKKYPKYKKKFHFVPFCIDTEFWCDADENLQNKIKSKSILFVGNDGNRDFSHVLKLAEDNLDLNFIAISSNNIFNSTKNSKNITYFNGSLFSSDISDNDLKEIYKNSSLTIVPLLNTLQPSGQSVTLQSLACGTPVIITKTDGFWDYDNFDNSNITFINNNSVESWSLEIEKLLTNSQRYEDLVKNGKKLVLQKFNIEIFNSKIASFFE